MNVWKYIYIKFYKFRRWGLGKTLGEDYGKHSIFRLDTHVS